MVQRDQRIDLTKLLFLCPRPKAGVFVCFSGIDGAGKSTQISALKHRLRAEGYDAVVIKQPTPWYKRNKLALTYLDSTHKARNCDPAHEAMALFAAADRTQNVSSVIRPALERGQIVLSDRYVYSGIAYMVARGIRDTEWLQTINRYIIQPHVCFLLDVPGLVAASRLRARKKNLRAEERDVEFLDNVRHTFLSMRSPEIILIDGTKEIEEISGIVWQITSSVVQQKVFKNDKTKDSLSG